MTSRWRPSRWYIAGYFALAALFLVALFVSAAQLWAFVLGVVQGQPPRWILLAWIAVGAGVAGVTGWQVGRRGKLLKPHMDRARGKRKRKAAARRRKHLGR